VLRIRTGFNADPDPAFEVKADPDPAFEVKADPDPAFEVKADPRIQIHDFEDKKFKNCPYASIMDVQATGEAFSPQREHLGGFKT
jgi:hypothetical protein